MTDTAGSSGANQGGAKARPLSPHLGVYRFQITMLTSITHRATGVALAGGSLLLMAWLISAALGPAAYDMVQGLLIHPLGRLVMLGFTWALVYHFLNGIRHLAWDAGWGFDIPTMTKTGWSVVVLSVIVTVAIWVVAYAEGGLTS